MKRLFRWFFGGLAILLVAGLVLLPFLGEELKNIFDTVESQLDNAPTSANGEDAAGSEDATGTPPPPDPPERYQVSIEAPKRMMLDSRRDLRVKVFIEGPGFTADETTTVTAGVIAVVSRELSAEVSSGSAFAVKPPAEVRQRLVGNEVDWVFGITALETGDHRLIVAIKQWREGVATVLTEKTWAVEVRVDPINALLIYLARNLPEAIGAGILLLIGAGFAIGAARLRKKAGLKPEPGSDDKS